MSQRVVLVAGCVLLLLLLGTAGTAGYLVGRPFPNEGGGQSRPSPDGKWVARATNVKEYSVAGGKRRFSELRIDTAGPAARTVRRMVILDSVEERIDWGIEGEVFWARNSSAVTFKCVTGKANLEVTLTP